VIKKETHTHTHTHTLTQSHPTSQTGKTTKKCYRTVITYNWFWSIMSSQFQCITPKGNKYTLQWNLSLSFQFVIWILIYLSPEAEGDILWKTRCISTSEDPSFSNKSEGNSPGRICSYTLKTNQGEKNIGEKNTYLNLEAPDLIFFCVVCRYLTQLPPSLYGNLQI
jgi:hypothetical protein